MSKAWNKSQTSFVAFQLTMKLKETKKAIIEWDKITFGKIQSQIKVLEAQLTKTQDNQWDKHKQEKVKS